MIPDYAEFSVPGEIIILAIPREYLLVMERNNFDISNLYSKYDEHLEKQLGLTLGEQIKNELTRSKRYINGLSSDVKVLKNDYTGLQCAGDTDSIYYNNMISRDGKVVIIIYDAETLTLEEAVTLRALEDVVNVVEKRFGLEYAHKGLSKVYNIIFEKKYLDDTIPELLTTP